MAALRCLLLLLFAPVLQAADVLLLSEENPPLNFTRAGQPSGFSVELVRLLAAQAGDRAEIRMEPWTRGYSRAQREAGVGLFSTARTPERESLFQWVGPLMQARTCFYSRRVDNLRVDSLEDARRLRRLALPRQWYSTDYLLAQGFDNLFTVASQDKMMHMFALGRGDLIVASDIAVPQLLGLHNLRMEDVQQQHCFMEHESYLAFSPQTDAALVARWQQALHTLYRDGRFQHNYRRWFADRPLGPRLEAVLGQMTR